MFIWQRTILATVIANNINLRWESVVSQPQWFTNSIVDIKNPVMSARTATKVTGRFGEDAFGYSVSQALTIGSSPFVLQADYTIEGHVWFDSLARSNQYIFDIGSNGTIFRWYGGTSIQLWQGGNTLIDTGFTPNINQWYHFAVVRKAGTVSVYIEGIRRGQATHAPAISQASFTWGNYGGGGSYCITGKLSQPRISVFARYDGPIVEVPTAPFALGTIEADYDPLWDRVQALVRVEGTSIVDAKGANSIELSGSPIVNTTVKRHGRNTVQFNGDGSFIRLPNTGGKWNLGSDDWAIEVDVYATETLSNIWRTITDRRTSAVSGGFRLGLTGMKPTAYYSSGTGGWSGAIGNVTGSDIPLNSWTTLSFVRAGSDIRLYCNGESLGGVSGVVGVITLVDLPITIGASSDGTNPISIIVGSVRITRYAARYSAPYTPKLTTALGERLPSVGELAATDRDPYYNETSLQLLFHEDMLESRYNAPPTVSGAIAIDSGTLLRGSPSLGFTTTSSTGLTYAIARSLISGSDFTVEADIKTNYADGAQVLPIVAQYTPSSVTGAWIFGIRNNKLSFYSNDSLIAQSSVDISDNQPHHVAAVRKDGTLILYVDGQPVASVASTVAFMYAANVTVGDAGGVTPASGYQVNISNIITTAGVARYTGAFTVPATPRSTTSVAA